MDAAQTPGYGTYQENFVSVVRFVEAALQINATSSPTSFNATQAIIAFSSSNQGNSRLNPTVQTALENAATILAEIASTEDTEFDLTKSPNGQPPLTTNFMDVNWQNDNPPTLPPPLWDLRHTIIISTTYLNRVQADAALGNSPLWFGGASSPWNTSP
ncbi:hypothetical protein BDP27DRAFT_1327352 [Rhodocollybia butyracea]|uniref:Uncharacterized protein n=1 Tax=Rhodocollybia butyracea TaxID=206335 RepID=A0A9P5PUQ3_9AGAR|nr:hypothetical protein BDP27DRAFT_1327352 [Rhodocollybia butyracea]